MEAELEQIHAKFRSSKHKQGIRDLQILIEKYSTDESIYKAHNRLGNYLNFMGEHSEAIQSWTTALNILEGTAGGVDKMNEAKTIDWINIAVGTARVAHRQSIDGLGVSRKHNCVSYRSSNLNESEELEWKSERLNMAIKLYQGAIDKFIDKTLDVKRKIETELGDVLFDALKFDEAAKIYENAFNNDGNAQWIYKAAQCSWKQGKIEQAYMRLQQLIETEPRYASAYKMCENYFIEKHDTAKADEYKSQYEFYSWVPRFCKYIEYCPENVSLMKTLNSDDALECIETVFRRDMSKRATEFLAAICYHHYHGPIENKAFELLEQRGIDSTGDERTFIGSILVYLIQEHQSICTIKGAANALAGMKHEQTFTLLERLLPQDDNIFFPMNIPTALGKLGDPRAIPLLTQIIEEVNNKIDVHDDDDDNSDLSDNVFYSCDKRHLIIECCLALSTFIDDPKVKQTLLDGTLNKDTSEACFAVLAACTGEKEYFDKLESIRAEGNGFHYQVAKYFQTKASQSDNVRELLMLNQNNDTKAVM